MGTQCHSPKNRIKLCYFSLLDSFLTRNSCTQEALTFPTLIERKVTFIHSKLFGLSPNNLSIISKIQARLKNKAMFETFARTKLVLLLGPHNFDPGLFLFFRWKIKRPFICLRLETSIDLNTYSTTVVY